MSNRWTNLLQNKTIIVTGASSGIGRECAIQCSKQGANLILIGRNLEKLNNTLEHLDAGKHTIVLCDLSQPDQIKAIKDELISFGPVHGLVHCSGRQKAVPLKTFDVHEFENFLYVNVSAAIELTRIVSSPKVFDKAGGSIIFTSSVSAIKAEKGKLEYSATKAALNSIVKTMALELAAKANQG